MNAQEIQLLRWVTGQLSATEAAEVTRRAARDPEISAQAARLRAVWSGLELPPASPPPLGFPVRVTARALEERDAGLSWSLAPRWVRLAAAAALVLGLGLGVALGREEAPVGANTTPELYSASLADSYWEALESTDGPAEVAR